MQPGSEAPSRGSGPWPVSGRTHRRVRTGGSEQACPRLCGPRGQEGTCAVTVPGRGLATASASCHAGARGALAPLRWLCPPDAPPVPPAVRPLPFYTPLCAPQIIPNSVSWSSPNDVRGERGTPNTAGLLSSRPRASGGGGRTARSPDVAVWASRGRRGLRAEAAPAFPRRLHGRSGFPPSRHVRWNPRGPPSGLGESRVGKFATGPLGLPGRCETQRRRHSPCESGHVASFAEFLRLTYVFTFSGVRLVLVFMTKPSFVLKKIPGIVEFLPPPPRRSSRPGLTHFF